MEKNKNWFDWLDQKDEKQVLWAKKYLSNRGYLVITPTGLIQWINEANTNLNMKPQDLGLRKLRNNMMQARKEDSKRKAPGNKPSNFILKSSTCNQLKKIAKLHNTSQYRTLEALIEDAAFKTKIVLEDIKKRLEDKKLQSKTNTRAKKTIEEIQITNLENNVRESELIIEFLNRKIKSLIFSEIKNRHILETLDMASYSPTPNEDKEFHDRCEAAVIQLNTAMKNHIELGFLTKNVAKQD